jgi:predicted O-methyltransferase YrrM
MGTMTDDLESYFSGFIPRRDRLLLDLEKEALSEGIPIVGPVAGALLGLLCRVSGARRILELGTATGYSAVFLARGAEAAGGTVVTVEMDPALAARARRNVELAGLARRIDVRLGRAEELLDRMEGPFDLAFLDHEKEAYAQALRSCGRLVRPGGLLVADNTGFAAAAEFNDALFSDPAWETVHLLCHLPMHSPTRDGLSLAVRV